MAFPFGRCGRLSPGPALVVAARLDAPGDVVEEGDGEIRAVEEIGVGIGIGEPLEFVADLGLQVGLDRLAEVLRDNPRQVCAVIRA